MKLGIINGPNLNLLGKREPQIYGEEGFASYLQYLRNRYPKVEFRYFQSNDEGTLVDALHDMDDWAEGIVLNPAAFTHTSLALGDAVKAISVPIVEVHISNVYQREGFRHKSYISPAAKGVITGLGLNGYDLAIQAFLQEQPQ
jgi:3-dehydroquinate dehydratase-2